MQYVDRRRLFCLFRVLRGIITVKQKRCSIGYLNLLLVDAVYFYEIVISTEARLSEVAFVDFGSM